MKIILSSGLLLAGILTSIIYSNLNPKPMNNTEIVSTFLNGFNNPSQIQQSLDLLADDYHFSNPMISLNSKTEFVGLAQQIGAVLTGVEVIRMADEGDWVAAMYIFRSSIPGVEENLATEWFKIEDGKIVESRLLYDATEWRKVYAQMEK